MQMFEKTVSKIRNKMFPGKEAFFLYASYGFPLEMIEEMLKERGFMLEKASLIKAFKTHREISRHR